MDQNGQDRTEMDLSGPNGLKWTKIDRIGSNGPNKTEYTKVD